MKCETCRFWKWSEKHGNNVTAGTCRKNAPVATGGLHKPPFTHWPSTPPDDWCGEHQPREVKQ